MKILCLSDQVDPTIYSTSIASRYSDVDIVISSGDLPMEYLGFIVSCLNKPLLFVFGNHNLTEYDFYENNLEHTMKMKMRNEHFEPEHGAEYIGFKSIYESGLLIMGLGGCMAYNKGSSQYTEFQMTIKILKLIPKLLFNKLRYGRYLDILVTHAPPLGIHDRKDPCHKGFKCYLWFLKKFTPKYLIHGHIHLYDLNEVRVSKYLETTIINAFGHYILNYGDS